MIFNLFQTFFESIWCQISLFVPIFSRCCFKSVSLMGTIYKVGDHVSQVIPLASLRPTLC